MPDPVPGQWNEVVLETPITVDLQHELWAGYEVIGQPPGKFPAGTDCGPALTGFGDLISLDGGVTWDALSEIAPTLSYNWNIQLFMDDYGYVQPPSEFRYNIYRRLEYNPYEYLSTVVHIPNQYEYIFLDDLEGVPWTTSSFCYKVTSVWDNGFDFCESEPALQEEFWADYVCALYTNSDDESTKHFGIFPNPARDAINITSNDEIEYIEVSDLLGMTIKKQVFSGLKAAVLSVAGLSSGVYNLRIHTSDGFFVSKVVVKHE